MIDTYDLFKFSSDLQDLIYENKNLKMENLQLKQQIKIFEDKLREDLIRQEEIASNWITYCLKK